jgi:flagellar protein FliS
MFSRTTRTGRINSLYAQVGVETSVSTASPHALILMLFDGFISAMKQARHALTSGATEDKARHIGMASSILNEGLRASLNVEKGGDIALNLRNLYDYALLRILQANLKADVNALDEVVRLIEPVREAWASIGSQIESMKAPA